MTKTRNLADLGGSKLLKLLDIYDLTEEQRRIIIEASSKPLSSRQWFYDQFTRNR